MFEEEVDFEFGGDDDEPVKSQGAKRGLLNDDDVDEEDLYPVKKMYGGPVDTLATTTILSLRESLEEKRQEGVKLQEALDTANSELGKWREVFRSSSLLGPLSCSGSSSAAVKSETGEEAGGAAGGGGGGGGNVDPEPSLAHEAFQKLQSSEAKLRAEALFAKKRENAMLRIISKNEQEISELRTQAHNLLATVRPSQGQTKKLLLDPAVHCEFLHLKKELEIWEKKLKEAQDELGAVEFTSQSKTGKKLLAKCRMLVVENDEMGREASEGKIHDLENKLAVQRQLNMELNRFYQELQDYVNDINDEAEKLQQNLRVVQIELQQRDVELQDSRKQADAIVNELGEGRDMMEKGGNEVGGDAGNGKMEDEEETRNGDNDDEDDDKKMLKMTSSEEERESLNII